MAITFPGEGYAPLKPDLESIESFDNSQIGGVEKFSTVSTGVISITDVVAKSGDTMSGTLIFDNTAAQGAAIANALSLSTTNGFYGKTPITQPAAVADATGAGDVVAQLNSLLARMRALGLIAT